MSIPNMDPNYYSLLIPAIILLGLLSICPTNASNSELDKQRRLFNKFNNNWDTETILSDGTSIDDTQNRPNPGLRFFQELLRTRQRPSVVNTDYDLPNAFQYDSDIEIESSLPYGIQNVHAATGRKVRSRGRRKSTFQSLCPSKRETVYLNLDPNYEYRPDFYEEVRCATDAVSHDENNIQTAVCSEAGFSCIQLNGTIFLTRRIRGDACWESETRTIPAGCECMWPKHQLGDVLMAHH